MNAGAIRTAGRYSGAWGAIVLCVVLLSCLFTFLGTITCAVLAGMMLGAFKGARWFSVAVSMVFPGVIFGMVRGARVELTSQQVILLAGLCFGIYWVTYLVSAVLFFSEQKERKPSSSPAPAPQPRTLVQVEPVAAADCGLATELAGNTATARESCLEQLQGNWVREAAGAGEPVCRRVIQIKEARLELKTMDADGRITLLARGDVTLQGLRLS